jgi:hypothetical protein
MPPVIVTEEGQRASDVVQGHLATNPAAVGRWVALRLSDGGSDGVVYDTRADAIRHQHSPEYCCFVKIPPTGFPPGDASRFLLLSRAFEKGGFRLIDPEDKREPIMPWTDEEFSDVMRVIAGGK